MSTEVEVRHSGETRVVSVLPYEYGSIADRFGYARALAHAGDMIPSGLRGQDVDATAAKVFLVLETGAMLGLHPMAALQGIDVIKGTAAISPQTFTGLARKAGHKLRIKEIGTIEGGDFAVEVTMIRQDDPEEPISARFSLRDALRAGLVSKYEVNPNTGLHEVKSGSDNWQKYPQDMVQWRALGRLARRGAADVTMGVGYFPEELEVAVNEEGVRRDLGDVEAPLLQEIADLDDKADAEALWQREHPRDEDGKRKPTIAWTEKVAAAFDAKISTITKDSRPPKEGAPGNTGVPEVDGTPSAPVSDPENAPEVQTPADEAADAPTPSPEAAPEVEDVDARAAREAAEYEAQSAKEFDEAAAFNSDALKPKP